ncbi:DNA-binding protein [Bifidobacterium adolescentis]|uniref:FitA-like ribbon-helix-helix domain-containing protein n=1 Tax=Bifidobacterium adolescentis TaxID=1680 RepID=UPI0040642B0D
MASITIRRLGDDVLARLKQSAHSHGRSTEAEVRSILEDYTAGYVAHGIVTAGDFFSQIRADLDGGLNDDELDLPERRNSEDGPRPAAIS